MMITSRTKLWLGCGALLAALMLTTGGVATGWALASNRAGTQVAMSGVGLVGTQIRTDRDLVSHTSTYSTVAGSAIDIKVPAGKTRLVSATFTTRASCSGQTVHSPCLTRIVARKAGTTTVQQLYPSSTFSAIDSVGTEGRHWATQSVARSKVLGAGTWRVWVQAGSASTDTTLDLSDWHFRADIFARP